MAKKVTYESLLEDKMFVSSAYNALRGLGEPVSEDATDILDTFLSKRRYFETNVAATVVQGGDITKLSRDNLIDYDYANKEIQKLPNIGSEGAAPFFDAIKDYGLAGVSDPTNLLSAGAAFFTFGLGGAAVKAGTEATKQGVKLGIKKSLKNKVNNLVSKEALKTTGKIAAIEAVPAFAGGTTQNILSQRVDDHLEAAVKDTEVSDFDFTKLNYLQALQQGGIEGGLSVAIPVIGKSIAKNVVAPVVKGAAKQTGKGVSKVIGDEQAKNISHTARYLANKFLPTGALDPVSLRLTEINIGETRPFTDKLENVVREAETIIKKELQDFDEVEKNNIINAALTRSTVKLNNGREVKAFEYLQKRSPNLTKKINEYHTLKRELVSVIKETPKASSKFTNTYEDSIDAPYMRDIYEKFTSGKRKETLEEFLKLPENVNLKDDLKAFIKAAENDPNQSQYLRAKSKALGQNSLLKFYDKKGKPLWKTDVEFESKFETYMKELYKPSPTTRRRGAVLEPRVPIPEPVKKFYGMNNDPVARMLETVTGIVDSSVDVRLASKLADSIVNRQIGVRALSRLAAIDEYKKLNPNTNLTAEDMVPLVSYKAEAQEIGKDIQKFSPIILAEDGYVTSNTRNVYVPKEEAIKLRQITDGLDAGIVGRRQLGTNVPENQTMEYALRVLDTFSTIQGNLKKGLTVYNPLAHVRNYIGAASYTVGSGNIDGIAAFAKLSKIEKQEVMDDFSALGFKGSQVEINQMFNRINDLGKNTTDYGKAAQLTNDLATIGGTAWERKFPKVARRFEKTYVGTDDFFKVRTYLGELNKQKKVWGQTSPEAQQLARIQYARNFIADPKGKRVSGTNENQIIKVSEGKIPSSKKDLKEFDSRLNRELAINKAMDIVPVYSRVPSILENMRGIPIIGSFTAFPAENLRNRYKIFKIAGEELREGIETGNKQLTKNAVNRLTSMAVTASLPAATAYAYNEFNGTENVTDALRQTIIEGMGAHALAIRKGKGKNKGKYYYTDLSYNNPDQYLLDIISPFMIAVANGSNVDESLGELFGQASSNAMQPFFGPSLAIESGKILMDYFRAENDEQRGNFLAAFVKSNENGLYKMARETAFDLGLAQSADRGLSEILKKTPLPFGVGDSGTEIFSELERDMQKLYTGEERYRLNDTGLTSEYLAKRGLNVGQGYDKITPLNIFFGAAREKEFNPKTMLKFSVSNLAGNASTDTRDFKKDLYAQLLDPTQTNINYMKIAKNYDAVLEQQFEAQRQVREVLDDFEEFMPYTELNKILYTDPDVKVALPKSNLKYVRRNVFKALSPISRDNKFFDDLRRRNPNINKVELRKLLLTVENEFYNRRLTDDFETKTSQAEYN